MATKKKKMPPMKADLSRLGLFKEMGYLAIDPNPKKKKKKEPPMPKHFLNHKPMIFTGSKVKAGDQSGFFSPHFLRLSEGDSYKTVEEIFRQKEKKSSFLHGVFHNAPITKMDCGKGSCFTTIHPCPKAFSPLTREEDLKPFKPALIVNFPKKGTGYGYVDITIGPYLPSDARWADYQLKDSESAKVHKAKRLAGNFKFGPITDQDKDVFTPYPVTGGPPVFNHYEPYPHPNSFKLGGVFKGFGYCPYISTPYIDPPLGAPRVQNITNKDKITYRPTTRVQFNRSWVHPSCVTTTLRKHINSRTCKNPGAVVPFDHSCC